MDHAGHFNATGFQIQHLKKSAGNKGIHHGPKSHVPVGGGKKCQGKEEATNFFSPAPFPQEEKAPFEYEKAIEQFFKKGKGRNGKGKDHNVCRPFDFRQFHWLGISQFCHEKTRKQHH